MPILSVMRSVDTFPDVSVGKHLLNFQIRQTAGSDSEVVYLNEYQFGRITPSEAEGRTVTIVYKDRRATAKITGRLQIWPPAYGSIGISPKLAESLGIESGITQGSPWLVRVIQTHDRVAIIYRY
jgi:hypothetical protein